MKKIKKRLKRILTTFKSIKWSKPKDILKGIGSVIVFTGFFIALFALIDVIGGIIIRL